MLYFFACEAQGIAKHVCANALKLDKGPSFLPHAPGTGKNMVLSKAWKTDWSAGESLTTALFCGTQSVAKILFFILNDGFSKCNCSFPRGNEKAISLNLSIETNGKLKYNFRHFAENPVLE